MARFPSGITGSLPGADVDDPHVRAAQLALTIVKRDSPAPVTVHVIIRSRLHEDLRCPVGSAEGFGQLGCPKSRA
ncbi:MAG: hypothetical protein L0H31_16425 [Nocardioidaceae bacterium]|nr:hypothetical protein [Nocardioidaceae bacterium]